MDCQFLLLAKSIIGTDKYYYFGYVGNPLYYKNLPRIKNKFLPVRTLSVVDYLRNLSERLYFCLQLAGAHKIILGKQKAANYATLHLGQPQHTNQSWRDITQRPIRILSGTTAKQLPSAASQNLNDIE